MKKWKLELFARECRTKLGAIGSLKRGVISNEYDEMKGRRCVSYYHRPLPTWGRLNIHDVTTLVRTPEYTFQY